MSFADFISYSDIQLIGIPHNMDDKRWKEQVNHLMEELYQNNGERAITYEDIIRESYDTYGLHLCLLGNPFLTYAMEHMFNLYPTFLESMHYVVRYLIRERSLYPLFFIHVEEQTESTYEMSLHCTTFSVITGDIVDTDFSIFPLHFGQQLTSVIERISNYIHDQETTLQWMYTAVEQYIQKQVKTTLIGTILRNA